MSDSTNPHPNDRPKQPDDVDASTDKSPAEAVITPNLAKDKTVISNPSRGSSAGSTERSTPEFLNSPRSIGAALVGQTLRHFRLDEYIGGGGMGVVFRAADLQLERTVAVKVLTHRHGADPDTVRRFRIEAQSAARLNHENIADVYFVDEDQGWNFIVFEYIEGENIRDIVARSGPLPIEMAIDIIAQAAAALDHAAAREVVHRDIKPSNILLTYDGRAKIVDMGLARFQQVEAVEDLTVSGVTLGTFDYISPEQGRDPRDADTRSDLYSLGCTFYFILTGQPPFPGGTVLQKLLSHTSDPVPNPCALRPNIPEDIASIIAVLLAKHPEQRYQHPTTLIADLRQVVLRNQLYVNADPSWFADTMGSENLPSGLLFRPSSTRRLVSLLPFAIPILCFIAAIVCVDWMFPVSDAALPDFRPPSALEGPAEVRSDFEATSASPPSDVTNSESEG